MKLCVRLKRAEREVLLNGVKFAAAMKGGAKSKRQDTETGHRNETTQSEQHTTPGDSVTAGDINDTCNSVSEVHLDELQ